MRKLLALLTLLPLLAGANAGTSTPPAHAPARADALDAASYSVMQPPLAGLAAVTALPSLPPPIDASRTATRAGRSPSDPLATPHEHAVHTRLIQQRDDYLACASTLRRARANVPNACSTPPPASTA
jgi:hypothetical protein